jgi:subtilisin family serine protease
MSNINAGMSYHTRRRFLKTSATALGGIAIGANTAAAESRKRFIVDAKNVTNASDVEVIHRLDPIDILVVRGSEKDVQNLDGEYAPDLLYSLDLPAEAETTSATDEPLYSFEWDKQDQDIPEAHEITQGAGSRVAVIDTGVAASHPDLQRAVNEDLSRNFTDDDLGAPGPFGGDHGTHVSGIVAADDRNEFGTVGTAPDAEVIDCRVFSPESLAAFADILPAILYAAEINCDAANLSLGSYPNPRQGAGSFYGKVLNRTITYANKEGTLIVTSAGNASADLQHDGSVISYLNEGAQALSVSATGPIGFSWGEEGLEEGFASPAFYTNYGTNAIDIAAPGGDADLTALDNEVEGAAQDLVLSTVPGGYGYKAGTSMAAPQVAGAAALVKSINPDYTASQVESALEGAASIPEGYDKAYYGAGYLDTLAALEN